MRATYDELIESLGKNGSPKSLAKFLEDNGWTFDQFLYETRKRYVPDYFKQE